MSGIPRPPTDPVSHWENSKTQHRLSLLALIYPGEWIQGTVSKQERYGAGVQGGPSAGFQDPPPGTHPGCAELPQHQTVTARVECGQAGKCFRDSAAILYWGLLVGADRPGSPRDGLGQSRRVQISGQTAFSPPEASPEASLVAQQ